MKSVEPLQAVKFLSFYKQDFGELRGMPAATAREVAANTSLLRTAAVRSTKTKAGTICGTPTTVMNRIFCVFITNGIILTTVAVRQGI